MNASSRTFISFLHVHFAKIAADVRFFIKCVENYNTLLQNTHRFPLIDRTFHSNLRAKRTCMKVQKERFYRNFRTSFSHHISNWELFRLYLCTYIK